MCKDKRIIDQEEFSFAGVSYIARLYHPAGKTAVYGEIVYKETYERPNGKMRDIARKYLKPYGVKIQTSSKKDVTHVAVRKLIEKIREVKDER